MKKTLFIAILLCFAVSVMAETKPQRRIYLWDVTLSMKGSTSAGYNASKDIYGEVKKFLLQEIRSIPPNETTEIVVLPFREGVLVDYIWKANATDRGKNELMEKITRGVPDKSSNTDIVRSVEYVMNSVITPDRDNVTVLLTDGGQSRSFGGVSALERVLTNWEQKHVGKGFSVLQYVVLIKEGDLPPGPKKIIDEATTIDLRRFINLQPNESLTINVKDDSTASIFFAYDEDVELPRNIRIQATTRNDAINISQPAVVEDGKITFNVPEGLRDGLQDSITRLPLYLELLNREEIEKSDGAIVFLASDRIELELINTFEKLLKVNFKEKLKGGNNWGRVRFYRDFLWRKYKPERKMKEQILRFEFNDYAMRFQRTYAEFEVYKKSAGKGRDIPAEGVILYKNGERCPDNLLRVCNSEVNADDSVEIAIGIAFTGAAEKGKHVFFLKEKESDLRVDYGDLTNGFLVEKRIVWNPLARNLFLLLLLIVAGLIAWRIFIRPLMYDRFKVRKLYFVSDAEGMKTVSIKGCTKVVCSRKKQSQSVFSRFFTGKIAFVQSDFWEQNMEIIPKDKKSVRVRPGRGFSVSPSSTVVIGSDTDITHIDTNKIITLKIN